MTPFGITAPARILFAEREAGCERVLRLVALALGHGGVVLAQHARVFQLLLLNRPLQAGRPVHHPEAPALLGQQLDQWHGRRW